MSVAAAFIALAGCVYRTWDRVWDVPLPDVHASADAAVIQRGEYLVFGPAHCVECRGDCFARMTTDDAGALYEFFRSLPPAGEPAPQEPTVKHASG